MTVELPTLRAPITSLEVIDETFALAGTFTISRGSRTHIHVVTVTLSDGQHIGRGECVPYARYDETIDGVMTDIRTAAEPLAELSLASLQDRLPAGAARNALDNALWDLLAKQHDKPVWQLAGLPETKAVTTAYTLSLDTPEQMLAAAQKAAQRPLLKIKLGGDGGLDLQRLEAVRQGAPDATLIVDANEGWDIAQYQDLAPELLKLNVAMVEQPLPADEDDALLQIERTLPVCADESCHDSSTLDSLKGKYDIINIKLDKTGGLTEALRLKALGEAAGFDIMVGCMLGTSLAMAPAQLVGQQVSYVDLDGPLLLAEDRDTPITFAGSLMSPASTKLWG